MTGPDPQLIRWISDGLKGYDLISVTELLDGIASGEFQLWRYPNGIAVTTITEHYGRRRLLVFLLAGDNLAEWQGHATADLKQFARANGITKVNAYARIGLEKPLKSEGWRKRQVVLELEV